MKAKALLSRGEYSGRRMHRETEKGGKKENKPGTVPPLSVEITTILLVFLGALSIVSLLHMPQRLSVQGSLDLVALAAFPLAYGIWMRKKWAFYASLILLEALILISPLIAAFSPYFGIEYNWISLLSFIVVGLTVLPLLISNEHHFGILKEAKLQTAIKNLPIFNTLFIIFGVALIIRTVLPYDTVFEDTVRFASDDAVFHMRLVENALFGDHFPRRLFFDAYTYFPHGEYLHFAPLYDQIIIFATWIIGLGSPTRALMEAVGAYYPAILGALVVFPVYIIGREIYNKYAGLVASVVVATLPGQFLSRSIIGFTDHHVGEVLFSTIAVMFLVLAIKRAKEELPEGAFLEWFARSPGEWVRGKNFPFLCYAGAILVLFQVMPLEWWVFLSLILFLLALIIFPLWKRPDSYAFYTILAGMALGFYLLTWVGGLFFVVIFILYGVLQYTIEGLRGEPNEYLCITLTPLFFIPLLMVLPFFEPSYPFYNIQQVGSLSVGVITFSIPLMYRYLIDKFGYRHGLVREKIAKAGSTKPQKIGTGEYICPICGKKSRGVGIVEHIKTKHQADIEKKSELVKLKHFFDENPELSVGLKKLGIGSILSVSPLEKMSKYNFLLPVFTITVFLGLSTVFFPSIIGGFFSTLTPSGTALTIAEVHPMDSGRAWIWFSTPFFIAIFAMVILTMDMVMRTRPEEVLILVWSIIMFVTVGGLGIFGIEGIGQNRFAYYYAINTAILTGLFSVKAFEFLTGSEEKVVKRESKGNVRSGRKGGKPKRNEAKLELRHIFYAFAILIIFVIAIFLDKTITGLVWVGIEILIPLTGIMAIFFVWIQASSQKRAKREEPLRKALTVISLLIIISYPFPLNAVAKPFPSTTNLPLSAALAIHTAEGGIGADEDWYEALRWMRNNTPEPDVDYYGLYTEPALNPTTGKREDYEYPPSAYGVMSWWDYGHIITWIAHRIPNANPFQAGAHEAAGYLIETNESRANEMLEELGARYIITDFPMVDFMGAPAWPSNPKYVMPTWAEKNPNPWSTMQVRLHFFDGLETSVQGGIALCLEHYRLVHESPTFYLPYINIDSETYRELYWWTYIGNYNDTTVLAKNLQGHLFSMYATPEIMMALNESIISAEIKSIFETVNISLSANSSIAKVSEEQWVIRDEGNKNVFIISKREGKLNIYLYGVRIAGQPNIRVWTPEYIQPVSFVKVFEYVKGARIEGTAPNGSLIEVSTTITTNQGRNFTYSARTTANDSYEFIVPYSTEGPVEGGTNFDVSVSPYTIRAGHFENETVVWDVEEEVRIHEEDVIGGRTIKVDLP